MVSSGKKLSRTLSVIVVFAVMLITGLLLLLILIPMLQEQLSSLLARLPLIVPWLQEVGIPWFSSTFKIEIANVDLDVLKRTLAGNWQDIGNLLGLLIGKIDAFWPTDFCLAGLSCFSACSHILFTSGLGLVGGEFAGLTTPKIRTDY